MARPAAHYATPTKRDLSERQREVLALIAAGKTNGEIAERLGISLDGAKWHVSEILGKVGVSTREQAADWWLAQRGVRSRVASWARVFAPLANWKVGVGVGAAGVVVVGAAWLAFGTDSKGQSQRVDRPTCVMDEVGVTSIEARDPDGAVVMAIAAEAPESCHFRGVVAAEVWRPGDPGSAAFPPIQPVSVDAVIDHRRTPLAYATWSRTCLGGQLEFGTSLRPEDPALGWRGGRPTWIVNRPPAPDSCASLETGNFQLVSAAVSSFLPDLGPEEVVSCYPDPRWLNQCAQADRLNQAFLNGLLADAAVRFAEPKDYTCPQPGTGGLGGPSRLCEGASAAEVRSGLPVAFHGSEGDVFSIAQLREAIAGFLRSGATRVATIGCPTSTKDCDAKFAIGFAVDAQPAAFYLVFEPRGDTVALVAAGVSGDNALEIRRGGTTITSALGETLFTPAIPPY